MSWNRFIELKQGIGLLELSQYEIFLYKHGLHMFGLFMLCTALTLHVIYKIEARKQNKKQRFDELWTK